MLDEMRLQEFLTGAAARLKPLTDDPALEARVLASHVTHHPSSWLLAHPDFYLSTEQAAALEALLLRRLDREPLPYVIGHWEFFGLDFDLTPQVLIPRPETELLVEAAIAWAQAHNPGRVIDVGTGSGCIAVTLAFHCPGLAVTATDISPQALAVARRNAAKHGVAERVALVECDLFPAGDAPSLTFDLIASNPPYIPTGTMKKTAVYGREPTLALDGGADGMTVLSRLLEGATGRLSPGGLLLVEFESGLRAAVQAEARKTFPLAEIEIRRDLLGLDRLLVLKNC
jgi:release factor glutamine methyltransferase